MAGALDVVGYTNFVYPRIAIDFGYPIITEYVNKVAEFAKLHAFYDNENKSTLLNLILKWFIQIFIIDTTA